MYRYVSVVHAGSLESPYIETIDVDADDFLILDGHLYLRKEGVAVQVVPNGIWVRLERLAEVTV